MKLNTHSKNIRIVNVVGARPNYMKIAPIMNAYKNYSLFEPLLVHTGQHYDENMNQLFFEELKIPRPDIYMEVGSDSHARQTARIMERFEPIVNEYKPDIVLVVGDVNSTIACALVAAKLGIRVAHVEAGLRSFDTSMPEEINRMLTDRISDFLFVSEESGIKNLRAEGIPDSKIFHVGNVMIDTLKKNLEKAQKSRILNTMGLKNKSFALVTLHRPSNVDDPVLLREIVRVLVRISEQLPTIFPVHPRTRKRIQELGLEAELNIPKQKVDLDNHQTLQLTEPLGYLDFLKLMESAKVVLTDSGGIQEETTILQTPCLTLRDNTERPATVTTGNNRIVGTVPENIIAGFNDVMKQNSVISDVPDLWDGKAADRIADVLAGKPAI
ncbi:MAG: UDP-N-acetylglucosamine 2-epimerase (non-hydrolyzing) [candidate division KSB1 bacterium]|jgi:UDP-N-acetylglucosamine 2-epimerase (non-hydrolysing)|nr:UDP-N-acetylglucosamine 2-epimerase (non-hydrolyzing) [candidate division KSB1 bacterium]